MLRQVRHYVLGNNSHSQHRHTETKIGAEAVIPSMVQMANNMMKKTDLTNILVNKFKANIITETMVLPNMDEWPMPYWPEEPEADSTASPSFFE